MAEWSCAACKAVYAGSIPASASIYFIFYRHSIIKFFNYNDHVFYYAQVVELVDTRDLKSLDSNIVPVQVRLWYQIFMIEFLNLNNTEPYDYFRKLYLNALEKDQRFIQAVCISSYNKNTNIVSSRYVNLKYIRGDEWYFYSNYESPKAHDFETHNQISANFFWDSINTQIRVIGVIDKASPSESDKYFVRRSVEKNALSISSKQSDFIHSYKDVIKNYEDVLEKIKNKDNIDRPSYWGDLNLYPLILSFGKGIVSASIKEKNLPRLIIHGKIFLQP